jgi:hypothetical protein
MQAKTNGVGTTAAYITERIRALLSLDDTDGVLEILDKHPRAVELSEFERDLREWGFVFGMAFAIARAEDPWETNRSVAARALMPAFAAYTDWSGEFRQPDRNVLVSAVVRAYQERPAAQFGEGKIGRELEDALIMLSNGCGSLTVER